MMNFSDKNVLETMLFDTITFLEQNSKLATLNPTLKIRYQSGLAALDLLNEEYKKLTGIHYVDQNKILKYHSKQWDV